MKMVIFHSYVSLPEGKNFQPNGHSNLGTSLVDLENVIQQK